MKYDIAIIGGGPAGLSAAITATSKGRKVVLFEAAGFSPRLRSVDLVADYMGIPNMSGNELINRFVLHAEHTGTFIVQEKVVHLKEKGGYFEIGTPSAKYVADAVILATGISRSNLISGEKEFLGRGVSYSAKLDALAYRGKRVAAIVTIPDAIKEVEYLADVCEEVIFLPRYKDYKVPDRKNVTVVTEVPLDITGTDHVTGLLTAGEFYNLDAVFLFRASDPLNSFLPDLQMRGRSVLVDDQAETSIDGVFAGGDCTGQPWQVSRAAGQGQKAAISAINYLAKRDELISTFG